MKYKMLSIFLCITLSLTFMTSCTQKSSESSSTDINTVASVVDSATAFEKAIANDGKWIIILTSDITINKDLVLDGDFKNGKKDDSGNDVLQRKIALYAQDSNNNITSRYTLTVTKLTIKSANASIQHGTFKGDLYIDVNNFQLVDAKVEGNVYFQKEEYKSSFIMDSTSSITGTQQVTGS
ncbi:MAG: hypothetical protein ACYCYI_06050 [Saccharofermentanales bacterium]